MRITFSRILFASSALIFSNTLSAQTEVTTKDRRSVAITVYNNDLGVVRDVRVFDVRSGTNEIRLRDVPTFIDATSVKIGSLKHPDAIGVVEQNFEYDLLNQQKLLMKYLDQQISITDEKGTTMTGILLAVERDKLTLQTPAGITMIPSLSRYSINVPKLAAGLVTKPTLVWKLESDKSFAEEPLEVMYQTGGMSWHAEYIVSLSPDDKLLDLSGWVSLENRSGATFENADLKLVAGAIDRVQQDVDYEGNTDDPFGMFGGSSRRRAPEFVERGMFEYHLYDLGRQTTLQNNQIKQIALLEATGVKATKKYTYRGGRNVEVGVEFENKQANNMGMPLPEGIVRVMKKDKDGTQEFVGEDRITHTPRDEKITLKVGDAFDVLGEHVITAQRSFGQNSSDKTIEITLKNRKDTDEKVDIIEQLGSNWEIVRTSHEISTKDAQSITIPVNVKARSELKVTFTVIYTYR